MTPARIAATCAESLFVSLCISRWILLWKTLWIGAAYSKVLGLRSC